MQEINVTIPVNASLSLAGRLFEHESPEAAIVLHGATGVPRDYYAAFGQWLAEEKRAAILIYHYRDCGPDAPPVKASRATMSAWGVEDQGAALDFLCGRYPSLPVEVIGHSLGGLFLPFHRNSERVRRLTAVASGPAFWRKHPASFMPAVLGFWFVLGPAATAVMGYMPGKILGLGADLAPGVYWQWRRWCMSPGFHRADWGGVLPVPDLERVTCDVRVIAVSDDKFIPPYVVKELAQFYPRAQVSSRIVEPREAGVNAIGHLRIFSQRCSKVWPVIAGAA